MIKMIPKELASGLVIVFITLTNILEEPGSGGTRLYSHHWEAEAGGFLSSRSAWCTIISRIARAITQRNPNWVMEDGRWHGNNLTGAT